MDEMRAMLDGLMGSDRNLSLSEREKIKPQKKHFSDPKICKYHLCGFCPYEEFRRTKNDTGDCPAVHDEDCKAQWEALDDREKERYGYERDLMRWLDRLLGDLRRRIDSNTERLSTSQKPLYLAEDQAAMEAMTKQIDELLSKAAELGEQGNVDAAQLATTQADELKERRTQLERAADSRSGNNATRGLVQSVCPVSGLIINDEESRLRDHHAGRNYNSWKKLHDTHEALKATFARRAEMRRARGSPTRREGGSRERGRGYDRDRDRDTRRRSRSRSRDRHHGRRRSRSRDRGGSRHYDRDRRRDDRGRDRRRDDYRRGEDRRERERSPEEGEVPL